MQSQHGLLYYLGEWEARQVKRNAARRARQLRAAIFAQVLFYSIEDIDM
jgi:hypothetical protein